MLSGSLEERSAGPGPVYQRGRQQALTGGELWGTRQYWVLGD